MQEFADEGLQQIFSQNRIFSNERNSMFLLHGRIRTAYLYRCVWSGITVDNSTGAFRRDQTSTVLGYDRLRPWE